MINVGTVLGSRYRLESRIAQGGMGDVYAGRDLQAERPVAVKVLRGTSPEDLQRFESEGRVLRRLEHPNVVQLYDAADEDGVPYLVMQLVDGPSLRRRLGEGPLEEEEVARIGRSIAAALAAAHERGIVHRDVKPANVLLGADGEAYLSDFGIARLQDVTGITRTGITMGTAAYLAPEQLGVDDVGPAADVYALGLVLLEALTGEAAFGGSTSEAALARLHRDPTIPDDVPDEWAGLLRTMTARSLDLRPAAGTVTTALHGPRPDPEVVGSAVTAPLAAQETAPRAALGADDGAGSGVAAATSGSGAAAVDPGVLSGRGRPAVLVAAAVAVALLLGTAWLLLWSGVEPIAGGAPEEPVAEGPVPTPSTSRGDEGGDREDDEPVEADLAEVPDRETRTAEETAPQQQPEQQPAAPQDDPVISDDGGGGGDDGGGGSDDGVPGGGPDGDGPPGHDGDPPGQSRGGGPNP